MVNNSTSKMITSLYRSSLDSYHFYKNQESEDILKHRITADKLQEEKEFDKILQMEMKKYQY